MNLLTFSWSKILSASPSYRQKLAFENSIKAIKAAIEPVGCRDFCTAIYCKMITSKKKKNPRRTGK
ncbi:hypothetical protein DW222_16270 [Blautia obeum]|uniref:Uncharacterized protein n=2 Tax=Blautia obeum TaxID=40520 RepID=A0A414VY22_9FIRM|nr:hypothetical protein DW222_16270 [Blautia obeum]